MSIFGFLVCCFSKTLKDEVLCLYGIKVLISILKVLRTNSLVGLKILKI
ncbi:hypothetical protein BDCR2A_00390 [Borrelia duttonii CR2A]|uniref:Uncharacterized protein n=1 Tax=Borrelia duttonii CR2A TaxID=1432657 RepID=W6THD4_9SPIR|nr:hypothetical protein BDCR2A_00390 [Borrelia duttonii CR2A]